VSVSEHIRPTEHFVYVLDHDAGLRSVLPESERARARQHAVAAVVELPSGDWRPAEQGVGAELGLLVLEGLLIRDVAVADARCGELVGPGTLLRPQDDPGTDAPMRHEIGWRVVEPARLAVLDRRFLRVATHWPALVVALVARANERAHNLGVMVSIHSLKRVDTRLLAFFWHLADRFGKVTADGVLIPLALTHRQLALLVGAQRPSVTSALGTLAERELLRRDERGNWILAVTAGAGHPDEVALETDDLVGAGGVRASSR
jgi:CRP-like cAMP-binding protein